MLNIFVTGTEGKTGEDFVTLGLAATMQSLGYQTCIYKPVETGVLTRNGFKQSRKYAQVNAIDSYVKVASSYSLSEDSPPVCGAEAENIILDKDIIKRDFKLLLKEANCLITQGNSGIMVPLGSNFLISDLIKTLRTPLLIVVDAKAGAINQALLTISHAEQKGINIQGIIINKPEENANETEFENLPGLIEEYSNAKILGIVNGVDVTKISANDLITEILNGIDIESVFDIKIAKLSTEND